MKDKISLIIPSKINQSTLEDYLINIYFWSLGPNEVIIINTYKKKININVELIKKLKKKKF